MLFLDFLPFFGYLGLVVHYVEGFGVELVDVEDVLFAEEAVGSHFQQLHGLSPVLLHEPAEVLEEVSTVQDEFSDLGCDLLYDRKTLSLPPEDVKFDIFYFPDYKVVDFKELFQDCVVL